MEKRNILLIIIVALIFPVTSCEKTEIGLNKAGDLTSFTGTWQTDNSFISVTTYSRAGVGPDYQYPSTTTTDSTILTFQFGAVRPDSVQITAVTIKNGVQQTPVKLPSGRWSFSVGTSTGDEMSGKYYFIVCETDYPHNYETGYGTIYTYEMKSPTTMEIRWVLTNNTLQNTVRKRALLIKQ